MIERDEILEEIKSVVAGISGLRGAWIYPAEYQYIPKDQEPIAIVEELRAVQNTTTLVASGYAMSNWTASILVIVARGLAEYPSETSAKNDMLLRAFEQEIIRALLYANLSEALLTDSIQSMSGWFQWEQPGGGHEPVWAVRVLLPVSQEVKI
jgi:hypothetical protein